MALAGSNTVADSLEGQARQAGRQERPAAWLGLGGGWREGGTGGRDESKKQGGQQRATRTHEQVGQQRKPRYQQFCCSQGNRRSWPGVRHWPMEPHWAARLRWGLVSTSRCKAPGLAHRGEPGRPKSKQGPVAGKNRRRRGRTLSSRHATVSPGSRDCRCRGHGSNSCTPSVALP